jgi:hypothetical protein
LDELQQHGSNTGTVGGGRGAGLHVVNPFRLTSLAPGGWLGWAGPRKEMQDQKPEWAWWAACGKIKRNREEDSGPARLGGVGFQPKAV